jgi:hypothetical protein
MKNKTMTFLLAVSLMSPASALLASAGDAGTQGPTGTTTGAPAATSKTKKHHGHGHHHKKAAAATSSTPETK